MKNNVLILSSLMTAILLAGCGDDASVTGVKENETNTTKISGIWSSGQYKNQSFDEQYIVIKSTGIITNYDDEGDSYNLGGNCYKKKGGNYSACLYFASDQGVFARKEGTYRNM